MKKVFLLLTYIILTNSLFPFPGDHNSLTCDKNFEGVTINIFDSESQFTANPQTPVSRNITESDLKNYFRLNKDGIANLKPFELENRKNIIAAIKADIAKPYPDSIVKKNIRDKIETSYEGKEVHVTKWGDSLSDFVQFYGIIGPAYPYFPQYGQQGYYGGTVPLIDSWSLVVSSSSTAFSCDSRELQIQRALSASSSRLPFVSIKLTVYGRIDRIITNGNFEKQVRQIT